MQKKKPAANLSKFLFGHERILWTDRPVLLRPRHIQPTQIIFGLFWTGIIVFMYTQFSEFSSRPSMFGRSSPFDAFSVIFTLGLTAFFFIGLGMIFHPVFHALKAWRTQYIITSERALIITDYVVYQHVLSYSPPDLGHISRNVHGDGTGTVLFISQEYTYTKGKSGGINMTWDGSGNGPDVHFGKRRYTGTKRIGFADIQDDEEAARLLEHLKNDTVDQVDAIDDDKLKKRKVYLSPDGRD